MYDPKGFTTQRILLIDTKYSWQWIGAIHEGLVCDDFIVEKNQLVNGIKLINFQDGNRSCDPDKYLKDAILLENELAKYPDNTRYQFYLAQSYLNANQKILALKNYEKCYQMEGNEDERWYSLYTLARLHNDLNYPSDIITNELSLAYHLRPQRAEPLFHLAHHHFKQGNYILSYALAVQGLSLSKPDDSYFVENWIYDYGLLIVYADAANSLGLKEIALNSYEKLLKKTSLPLDAKNNIEQILLTIKK
jgi:tetratricopeptide (TPR) repeat protein